MTITELESLLKRAEDVTGCKINLSRDSGGKWNVVISGPPHNRDRYGIELGECVDTLKKWATPPKPDMLAVMVPIATAEFAAEFKAVGLSETAVHSRALSAACIEALKPYQEQP